MDPIEKRMAELEALMNKHSAEVETLRAKPSLTEADRRELDRLTTILSDLLLEAMAIRGAGGSQAQA